MDKLFFSFIFLLLFTHCSGDTEDIYDDVETEDIKQQDIDLIIETESDSLEADDVDPYYHEMEVEHIYFDSANVINIVFIGEGFSKGTLLRDSSEYRHDAILHYEYLFSHPPFSQFKSDFNYSIVYAAAVQGTTFNYEDEPSSSLDYMKIETYVSEATGAYGFAESTLILFGVNRSALGYAGNKIAFFPVLDPDVMMHEVGHAFGGLADEYSYGIERSLVGIDYPNIDLTDNPSLVKWNRFFGIPGYESIGIFEGGYYRDSLVWRPSENSVMRETRSTKSWGFNAVGREAIVKEIYRLKGDSLSFDAFLKIDTPNRYR